MPERVAFEYALVRVVPRVERGECLNAGAVLVCRSRRFLSALVCLDRARMTSFAPFLDSSTIDQLERQIEMIPRICAADPAAGPIARLTLAERWHWLTAPASTILQPGPVHTGLCEDPGETLQRLFDTLVAMTKDLTP